MNHPLVAEDAPGNDRAERRLHRLERADLHRRRVRPKQQVLALVAPERVTYKCKLEGYDEEWTELGSRRTKSYTNLDHGEYVFRVMAANQDGVLSAPGLVLPITITPPFTATIWFIGLMILAGSILILLRIPMDGP